MTTVFYTLALFCRVTYTCLIDIFDLFHNFCFCFTQQLKDGTIIRSTSYEWVLKQQKCHFTLR